MPQYIEYEGLTDKVYPLGNGININFTVKLAVPDKDGNRYFNAHKEYQYYGNKYNDRPRVISLKRDFDYYLYISDYNDKDFFLPIRPENMIFLQAIMNTLVNYFLDESNFGKRDNRIIIKKKIDSLTIDLYMEKWISFEPIILLKDNREEDKGIRVYLSSNDKYIDLTLNKFFGLAYTLISMNMYQSAITMLNYFDEKKCGSNFVSFNSPEQISIDREMNEGVSDNFKIRKPINNRAKSYFDKSDELDNM